METPTVESSPSLVVDPGEFQDRSSRTQVAEVARTGHGGHQGGLVWLALFVVVALMLVQLPPMIARQDSVVHSYSALVEVDALARQQYVEPIDAGRLVDGAIRGMLLELDPYSGYISPAELPGFERRQKGEFTGVGVELGVRGGQIMVIAPVEGSPAARAGILPGDLLISVNGREVKDRSVFDVEEMLTGPSGSTVEIVVQHGPDERESPAINRLHRSPRTVRVVRGAVTQTSVRGFRRGGMSGWDYGVDRDQRIGYIRVSNFHDRTVDEFDAALRELRDAGARALVLDLRFNPGGLMDQAVRMADRFIESGVLLSTVNRRRAVGEYLAKSGTTAWPHPVVVLINGGSASSAEIVAGSLQSHRRATVVGAQSFGKGSVQHLVHLSGHKAAVKLTVAYYRLPDGRIIHRGDGNSRTATWGIVPDVVVRLSAEEEREIQASRSRLDLGHPEGNVTNNVALTGSDLPGHESDRLIIDRQLERALEQATRMIGLRGPRS